MEHSEVNHKILFGWKLICLFICWGVFFIIYHLSGTYAASFEYVPSIYFTFENYIPFLSYTIYPYMSSGLFFVYVFFLCRTPKELEVLSKRILFITIVSGACFLLFPLKQNFIRPDTANVLFTFLDKYDTPFNQAPSLHIGYAFIFWSAVGNSKFKILLRSWLCLMAISTLTLYQHHLIDVTSAFALGCVTSLLFPYLRERNKQIAKVYLMASALVLNVALFVAEYSMFFCIVLLWCVITLILIARAYYKSDSGFLKNNRGTISLCNYILYLPYILTYWIMWRFSRKTIIEIASGIYVGSRISGHQAKRFSQFSDVVVFDLSAELPENSYFRKATEYHCVPMLDIGSSPDSYKEEIASTVLLKLENSGDTGKIYIHCTMGRFRCRQIADLLLHKMKPTIKQK